MNTICLYSIKIIYRNLYERQLLRKNKNRAKLGFERFDCMSRIPFYFGHLYLSHIGSYTLCFGSLDALLITHCGKTLIFLFTIFYDLNSLRNYVYLDEILTAMSHCLV